jgi:4-amino-4-deoxy-L-arabinose transferase-like glycosyltransferase
MRSATTRWIPPALHSFPRPLAGLLVVVALFGLAWALVVPAWQSPDEDVHFAYVQSLAERHQVPGSGPHNVSTAQLASIKVTNSDSTELGIGQPEWSPQAFRGWLGITRGESQADGGGHTTASTYPPAYYAAETLGYALAGPHANVLDHLYAARMFSVLWLLLTTVGAWLLAGELTGRRRPLQLLAAGCVGLWPMLTYLSASVNPDSLLYASWTWALWLGVVILRRGLTVGRAAAFTACVAAALLTKATSLALLPAATFVLLFGLWRLRHTAVRRAIVAALVGLVVFAVPVGGWEVDRQLTNQPAYAQATDVAGASGGTNFNAREFLSYVWEYYLPRLPGQQEHRLDLPVVSSYPAYNVWVATSWAAFGWVTVYFDHGVYPWFLAVTLLIGLGALAKLSTLAVRHRRSASVRTAAAIAVFFGLALVVLLGGLHLTEYRQRGPTNQGRYLFPLASLAGMAVVAAVTLLPKRMRTGAVGAVMALLVLYQFACLGLVASHYYA